MSASSPQIPRFPPEIERCIFEVAADDDFSSIPTLQCVARRFNIWLRPMLFHTIRVSNRGTPTQLAAMLDSEPDFLQRVVRRICMDRPSSWPEWFTDEVFETLLATCTGAVDLVVFGPGLKPAYLDLLTRLPALRFLACSLEALFVVHASAGETLASIEPPNPWFANLTHLEMSDLLYLGATPDKYARFAKKLSRLPRLTHLAFRAPPSATLLPNVVQGMLRNMPTLRVLVVLWSLRERLADSRLVDPLDMGANDDVRLVVGWWEILPAGHTPTYIRDSDFPWRRILVETSRAEAYIGALRGVMVDYWTLAEEFIGKKRRGHIPANLRWMDKWSQEH